MAGPQQRQVLRMRGNVVFGLVILVVFSATFWQELSPVRTPAGWALLSALWLCSITPILRLAWAGVVLYPDGRVRVRNVFQTRTFQRSQLRGASLRRWGLLPSIGYLDLVGGGSYPITTIQPPNALTRPRNRTAQDLMARLDEFIRESAIEASDP